MRIAGPARRHPGDISHPLEARPGRPFPTPPGVPTSLPLAVLWLPLALAAIIASISLHWLLLRATNATPTARSPSPARTALPPTSSSSVRSSPPSPVLSPVFTPEVRLWEADILRWAENYNLHPNLIATLMQIESCGHPSIRSSAGALGLFQVMPYHFKPHEDPTDPDTNAKRGLRYLSRALILADGNPRRAFAGYNGGHGVISLKQRAWPAETRRYVTWATGILRDIAVGSQSSSTLNAWLKAGGASLCRKAALSLALVP